jgi:hypothetical protein
MATFGRMLRDRPLIAKRAVRAPAVRAGSAPVIVTHRGKGVITGGGHIVSPRGSYVGAPNLAGTASFGFVSSCLKTTTTPHGVTEFRFDAAGLHFHSTSYQRLVIAGCKATYDGTGVLNGNEGFSFRLTATEGGEHGVDGFRIKIWNTTTGAQLYDSLPSAHEPDVTTPITGGSIAVYAA